MTTPCEAAPSAVPATAQPDGEVLGRWPWTERAVWTERMLTALETGVDFLGYHFQTTRWGRLTRWPRKKSLDKFKATIRAKTTRKNGRGLPCIIADLYRTLQGWFGYFQHSCGPTFRELDSWIRGRLRSILRKRAGRRGRGRGRDHQRWPNAYFAALGYFSLEAAWVQVSQPRYG